MMYSLSFVANYCSLTIVCHLTCFSFHRHPISHCDFSVCIVCVVCFAAFMCRKGQYLNLTGEQQCADCPPGTYSLGNAAVFDYWDKIPDSFIVSVEQSESSPLWGQFANFNDFNCSQ